jgi:hypothetical protein
MCASLMRKIIPFDELTSSDLVVDATYKGGTQGNFADDPIGRLLRCGNQGGFRIVGKIDAPKLVVLYSSLNDPDWPDELDYQNGLFVYYGDNKKPGHKLHNTPRKGNQLLRQCFDAIHISPPKRKNVPPFFVFTKGAQGRDVIFRGLAAPGSEMIKPTEDLIAVWKSKNDERFQNYRAFFTILNVQVVPRLWINELISGKLSSRNRPHAWQQWIKTGNYEALKSEPTLAYRKKKEQMPSNQGDKLMLRKIFDYFKDAPFAFEHCAAKIATLMDPNIISFDVTRPWRDGGRDAVGLYRIGTSSDNIEVEFALEAKCFEPGNSVGIRHTSRLISRLRHRQFGIFVTTSYIAEQAYSEIREDKHPVVVIAGRDIVRILKEAGIETPEKLAEWLKTRFPL